MPNNILIVDDQVELTKILGEYFRVKKGYNVLTATDGKVALNVIREQTPELVLLDMKLPSVNGLEILKILRKDYPGTKVIVMTAYDTEFKKEIDATKDKNQIVLFKNCIKLKQQEINNGPRIEWQPKPVYK